MKDNIVKLETARSKRVRFKNWLGMPAEKFAIIEQAAKIIDEYDGYSTGPTITQPRDTYDYLKVRIGSLPHEVFVCMFLDNLHRVVSVEEMFRGTIDGANVHPREVVVEALHQNATAVILAHNHTNGERRPSDSDHQVTKSLVNALGTVGIRVLDHIIVGHGEPVSMANLGLL